MKTDSPSVPFYWRIALNLFFKSIVILAVLSVFSCEVYNAPPEPSVVFPEGGANIEGQAIEIEFSEAIDKDSLNVRVWDVERDIENQIPANATPLIKNCSTKSCDDSTLTIENNLATLTLEEDFSKAGKSYVLEVLPGLTDKDDRETIISYFFDIQFRADTSKMSDPVEFDNGVYILLAQVEQPLPAVLTLVSDIIVLEDGTFALAGAEGDEINGDAKNTRNPENLIIDETDLGYTVFATGKVTSVDGVRTLESDTFDVTIPAGPLEVDLAAVRLFATILKNEDTGKDQISGSLSFEKITIRNGDKANEREGATTALIADFVPTELIPEGTPVLCENLCGAVELGKCEPPEGFPIPEICAE